ncbi:polyphosphate kinase 2 family protein [Anaerolineales bacterium]
MVKSNAQLIQPEPLSKINLSKFDPAYTGEMTKEEAEEKHKDLLSRLKELQEMLYAQHEHALLIVLQAMDAGGKDGTIKKVFQGVNPQGVKVANFKQPSKEELDHDFLWRIHRQVPGKGYIGIFNRSHYEDVLVVRVNHLVPEKVWQKRYEQINQFELMLSQNGVRILKFFLHISKDEQKERFQKRLDKPEKRWKFSLGDLPVREQWDQYMRAYEVALTKCNTEYAPWQIVPANHKWFRNHIILSRIVSELEDMKLKFPEPEANLENVVIPD